MKQIKKRKYIPPQVIFWAERNVARTTDCEGGSVAYEWCNPGVGFTGQNCKSGTGAAESCAGGDGAGV